MHFADIAGDAHIAAGDAAREIAGDEIALVRARKLVGLLLHVKHVIRAARGKLDMHIPSPGEIRRGRLGRLPEFHAGRFAERIS